MTSDELVIERDDPVLRVTFNRPKQHNAMTWLMYERLVEACELADGSTSLRVMLLTGAGDRAFVSGTDISQFDSFATGEDGIAYERRIGGVLDRLRRVTIPTVARIKGYCIGGGLALAATCDLRVVSRDARFGAPVARTLGNCLSSSTISLLVEHFGTGRTLDLVLRARLLDATEAAATGFVSELCEPEVLDDRTEDVVRTLLANAPLTMWAAKEVVRRLGAGQPADDDIIARVYASNDFRAGVAAFKSRGTVKWTGN